MTTSPAGDVSPDRCDHVVAYIARKPIHLSEWDGAVLAFARVVDDFNVRGQRDEIPHPGYIQDCRFCPECGHPLDAYKRRSFSEVLTAVEAERKENTLSAVAAFLAGLTDDDIKAAVIEIQQREYDGVLPAPEGKFAQLQRLMQQTAGRNVTRARQDASFEILKLAAFKWAGVQS